MVFCLVLTSNNCFYGNIRSVFGNTPSLPVTVILDVLPPFILPSMCLIFLNNLRRASIWFTNLRNTAVFISPASYLAMASCVLYSKLRLSAIILHLFLWAYACTIYFSIYVTDKAESYTSNILFCSTMSFLIYIYIYIYICSHLE